MFDEGPPNAEERRSRSRRQAIPMSDLTFPPRHPVANRDKTLLIGSPWVGFERKFTMRPRQGSRATRVWLLAVKRYPPFIKVGLEMGPRFTGVFHALNQRLCAAMSHKTNDCPINGSDSLQGGAQAGSVALAQLRKRVGPGTRISGPRCQSKPAVVSAEPPRDLEQELWDVVTREWPAALHRLSSLLDTDVAGPER